MLRIPLAPVIVKTHTDCSLIVLTLLSIPTTAFPFFIYLVAVVTVFAPGTKHPIPVSANV